MPVPVTDGHEGLETGDLTGGGHLLHGHDLHHLVLQLRPQEEVDDLELWWVVGWSIHSRGVRWRGEGRKGWGCCWRGQIGALPRQVTLFCWNAALLWGEVESRRKSSAVLFLSMRCCLFLGLVDGDHSRLGGTS